MTSSQNLMVGLDLGGTNVQGGVVDGTGQVLVRDKTKTKAEEGEVKVIKRIGKLVDDLLDAANLQRRDLAAIGIGAPGAIDIARGVVLSAPNLGWENVALGETLQDTLGVSVVVDNDVNVGTWGEACAGAGQGCDDLMGIFVGTGVGGALVLDGRIYHGPRRTAGEVGHTVMNVFGRRGERTLEDLASRRAIGNRLMQLLQKGESSVIDELSNGGTTKIKSKMLRKAWEKQDPLALEVIEDAAHHVGVAAANAVTLLSIPRVVLGGGVVEALGEHFTGMARDSFQRHVFPPELRDTQLLTGELGDDAGIVGAAALARTHAPQSQSATST